MLTLNLVSDGSPGDLEQAISLEYNLGVRVVLNDQPVTQAVVAPVVADEPHPVLERETVVITPQDVGSFTDLLNQQVPPTEVVESSP